LNTGLLAHYPLDEPVGATAAYDSAGSVNGTVQGGTTFVPDTGVRGGAAKFDPATNDHIDMGDNFGFTDTSFSIQAWVKLDSGDVEYPLAVPIAKHHSGIGAGYFLTGGNVVNPTDAPFSIGSMLDIGSTYKGWGDEVRVYNRVLDPTEIQALYLQTPLKPFASFVPSLRLAMKPGAKDGTFTLSGAFGLDAASDGVNPAEEAVTLQVGDYTTMIPAGSFKSNKAGKYVYNKILPEITLIITITPFGGANYSFAATAKATDLTRKVIPIEVGLSIGNEGAHTTLFTDNLTAKP
jgi:hypothetical protein